MQTTTPKSLLRGSFRGSSASASARLVFSRDLLSLRGVMAKTPGASLGGPGWRGGGWVGVAAAPGVRAGGKRIVGGGRGGESSGAESKREKGIPPTSPFLIFTGALQGEDCPSGPQTSPPQPLHPTGGQVWGEGCPLGRAATPISKSRAARHAFLVCLLCFCFNRTDYIIFSRASVLHGTFQNSSRSSQRSLEGLFGGRGRIRKFLCRPRAVQQLCKKGIKKKIIMHRGKLFYNSAEALACENRGLPLKRDSTGRGRAHPEFPRLPATVSRLRIQSTYMCILIIKYSQLFREAAGVPCLPRGRVLLPLSPHHPPGWQPAVLGVGSRSSGSGNAVSGKTKYSC